jgi:hypothetical protein
LRGSWGKNKEREGERERELKDNLKKEKEKGVIFQSGVRITHRGIIDKLYEVKTPIKVM